MNAKVPIKEKLSNIGYKTEVEITGLLRPDHHIARTSIIKFIPVKSHTPRSF